METGYLKHSSRRAFLQQSTLMLMGMSSSPWMPRAMSAEEPPALKIGLMTDIHYADIPNAGTRCYRESIAKVREAVAHFNTAKVDLTVELGDLIDAAETVEGEINHLHTIEQEYAKVQGERHYVLGNHCLWTLNKKQFLEHCGAKQEFYSFDRSGFHFVILDACYRQDGVAYGGRNNDWKDSEIPPAERAWLQKDLATTTKPTLVFVHQRLDIATEHGIKSGPVVRQILEQSGHVIAVFQGHHHINDCKAINGIQYCTLTAMVDGSGAENNAYGLLSVYVDHSLKLEGFHRQRTYSWPAS